MNHTGAQAQVDCYTCPAGDYCLTDVSQPAQCPAGHHRDTPGAVAPGDCLECSLGTYSLDLARTAECPLCAVNHYCNSPIKIKTCPLHTQSLIGSSSLLNCRCNAGYRCAYSKKIYAIVTINSTVAQFNADVNSVKTNFVSAVATAAGVAPSHVTIHSVTSKTPTVGRRLLSLKKIDLNAAPMHEDIEIHTSVRGATHLHNLDKHLAKLHPNGKIHVRHQWEEAHELTTHKM